MGFLPYPQLSPVHSCKGIHAFFLSVPRMLLVFIFPICMSQMLKICLWTFSISKCIHTTPPAPKKINGNFTLDHVVSHVCNLDRFLHSVVENFVPYPFYLSSCCMSNTETLANDISSCHSCTYLPFDFLKHAI